MCTISSSEPHQSQVSTCVQSNLSQQTIQSITETYSQSFNRRVLSIGRSLLFPTALGWQQELICLNIMTQQTSHSTLEHIYIKLLLLYLAITLPCRELSFMISIILSSLPSTIIVRINFVIL